MYESIKQGSFKKQTGAALFTCLVLLVILTLIGVTAMTSSTLQERMAGNTLNNQLAFQAAEAALREGEQSIVDELDAAGGSIAAQSNDGQYAAKEDRMADLNQFTGGSGMFENLGLPDGFTYRRSPDDDDYPLYENIDLSDWFEGEDVEGASDAPNFMIEFYGSADVDPDCGYDPSRACEKTRLYRITARGTGLNDKAITLLQSIYYEDYWP